VITAGGPDFEAADVFAGIRNTAELQMALINEGLGETTRPIYYFACDEASGGLEMANYLFELPNQYIVPGSHRACGPFDFTAFRAAADDVAARKHPVIAMGNSRADQFLYNLWGGSRGDAPLSERLVVVIGMVPSSRLTRRPPSPAAAPRGRPCHSHGPGRFPSSWAATPAPSKPPASPPVAAPRLKICAPTLTLTLTRSRTRT
jgi:hypothetical protein